MKLFTCFFLAILFCSCYHKITRVGYDNPLGESDSCEVKIVKFMKINDSIATWVGAIKLGDSGFSTICKEQDAINILKRDACGLKANLINITEEIPPSFTGSSCYRCSAVFYKSKTKDSIPLDSNQIKKAALIQNENMNTRKIASKSATASFAGYLIGYTAGAIIGYYLAHVLFSSR